MNQTVTFKVRNEINYNFKPVWLGNKPYYILKGGRNSFKSSVIALKLVRKMLEYLNQGKRCNIVIVRKVANSIRDSVFPKMQWALNKFGIEQQFKVKVTPFKLIHQQTGSTIYFYGQDDFEKLKGNDINDLIAVWYEEAAEFKDSEEFDQSNATFMRNKHKEAPFVEFYWSFNPPRNPYSWINEWVDSLATEQDWLVHQSTYLDDKLGFVTDQMLKDIERIKKNDFDYYRYLYLGEAVGLGTNVYNMRLINLIDEVPEGDPIVDILVASDTGHQTSATVVLYWGVSVKGNLYLLDTYYYEPAGKVYKKAPSELSKDIHGFLERQPYQQRIRQYTIDSAEGALRNQYYKDYAVRWHPVGKKQKHIMIDHTQELIAQGRVFVLNKDSNQIFLEQCKRYEWDEATIRSDVPQVIKIDDHCPDAFQYMVVDNLRYLGLKK